MKKTYLSVALAAAMAGSLITGCGSAAKTETTAAAAASTEASTAEETTAESTEASEETSEAADPDFMPADFLEERAKKNTFDSYEDIISYLDGETEGFAYVSMTGSTAYVLAVSNLVAVEDGTTTEANFYAYNKDDKLVNVGMAYGDETHPLRIKDGTLYADTDTEYGEMQINSDSNGLTYVKHMEKFQESDGTYTYSGFSRETAEGDSTEIEDVKTEEQFAVLFDTLSDVPAITFTRATYASYDEIISGLPAGSGYAYITLNGYDGKILAVSSSTFKDGDNNYAIDAALYAENNGKAELLASIQTGGTAYPITVEDGILYYNTRVQFAQADAVKNADGKYQLNYIKFASVSYNTDGEANFETKGDISADEIKTADDFYNLFTETEGKTPVTFTVVK